MTGAAPVAAALVALLLGVSPHERVPVAPSAPTAAVHAVAPGEAAPLPGDVVFAPGDLGSAFGDIAPAPGAAPSRDAGAPGHAAPQPALGTAAERFARHWAAGESGSLAELVASGGVRLHLDRANRSPLPPRQASAALRDYFAGHRPGTARLGRVSEVGGVPARGFAEVIWHAAAAGTTEMKVVTVFVGFVLEGNEADDEGSWKVDEIRVLPVSD